MKTISHVNGMFPYLLTRLKENEVHTIVIVCPDYVESRELMKQFADHKIKWLSGEIPHSSNNLWGRYSQETVYILRCQSTITGAPQIFLGISKQEFVDVYIESYMNETIPVLHAKALLA